MLPLHPSRTSYPPHHNHLPHHLSPPSSSLYPSPQPLTPPPSHCSTTPPLNLLPVIPMERMELYPIGCALLKLHSLLFTLHPAQAHKNNPEKLVDLHYVPAMATLQSQGRLGWI